MTVGGVTVPACMQNKGQGMLYISTDTDVVRHTNTHAQVSKCPKAIFVYT